VASIVTAPCASRVHSFAVCVELSGNPQVKKLAVS
jgi:hypothetical protein